MSKLSRYLRRRGHPIGPPYVLGSIEQHSRRLTSTEGCPLWLLFRFGLLPRLPGLILCTSIVQKLFQGLDDQLMIFVLFETADDDDPDDALDARDPDGHTAAVDGVLARRLAEHVFLLKRLLVTVHLVVHEPRAHAPSQDRAPFARHPDVVVRLHARSRDGVEEEVVAVRERDVDDGGQMREGAEAVADRQADLERVVGREVWQDQAFFLFGDGVEL